MSQSTSNDTEAQPGRTLSAFVDRVCSPWKPAAVPNRPEADWDNKIFIRIQLSFMALCWMFAILAVVEGQMTALAILVAVASLYFLNLEILREMASTVVPATVFATELQCAVLFSASSDGALASTGLVWIVTAPVLVGWFASVKETAFVWLTGSSGLGYLYYLHVTTERFAEIDGAHFHPLPNCLSWSLTCAALGALTLVSKRGRM